MLSRLSNLVYDLEEQVEESLDILNGCYRDLAKVISTPVFYDDPVIRQTISSLKKAHESILVVANKIVSFSEKKTLDKKDDREERS